MHDANKYEVTLNLNLNGRFELHVPGLHEATTSINRLGDALMSLSQDAKDFISAVDAAANKIAQKLTDNLSKLKNSMTDAELAEVKALQQAEIEKLTAMGADPADPLPPAVFGAKKKP